MSQDKVQEEFVETLSAVNCANGVVRLFFVGQDLENLSTGEQGENPSPELRHCVTMPLAGFLYAASVVQNFLEDDKVQDLIARHQQAGLLPPTDAGQDGNTQSGSASAAD